MKKCLLFISLTVLFFSCSKDESLVSVVNEEVITTSENKTPLFQSEATSSGEEIKAKIQRFRERLQAIKDKEINFREADLTTDEAKWNIEATLNATYCKADTPFSTYDKSESQFTVPLQNGVIDNEDLLAALDETDLATLEVYLERQNIISGKAMTLLALNGQEYDEPVYVPSPPVEERRINEEDEQDNEISQHLLKVYPNPAQEYFIVEYAIADNFENSYLVVTDINGDVVYRQSLNYEQDQLIIATQPFIAGQYFCTLEQQSQILKSEKIVLVK